jgi:cycloartenol synthase
MMVAARAWIHARGGAHWVTSWGKFWLAVLGVHSWDGLNPLTPEFWLLPHSKWTGIGYLHPGRYWCHCRMVRARPTQGAYRKSCRGQLITTPCFGAMHAWLPVSSHIPLL